MVIVEPVVQGLSSVNSCPAGDQAKGASLGEPKEIKKRKKGSAGYNVAFQLGLFRLGKRQLC